MQLTEARTPSWRAGLIVIAALIGCTSNSLRHVDDADDALRRGRLEEAERAYARALAGDPDLDEPERDAWVVAKVEQGRANISRARLLQDRPWKNLSGAPAELLARLHETHNKLRSLGGDPTAEAAIVEAMNGLSAVALRALSETAHPAWTKLSEARRFAPFPELTQATLAPIAALQSAARSVHGTAASAPGAGPLARRVHAATGAWIDEAPLASARDLAAPYARGVAVTLAGPAAQGCAAIGSLSRMPAPGATRSLEVTVEVARCEARTQVTGSTREVTWSERVLDHVVRKPVVETRCHNTYTEVRECFGNPLTCYSGTFVKTGVSCSTVEVGMSETPIYRMEPRTGSRPIEVQSGEYVVELTWTATLDGRTWRGDVRRRDPAGGTRGSAFAVFGELSEGWTSAEQTFGSAGDELARELLEVFEAQVAGERAAARSRAEQLASDPDAADEAWVVVALLGDEVAGRWREWGLTGADLRRAFEPSAGGAQPRLAIDATRTFSVPERPRVTAGDLKALESRLVPTLGATIWIDVHTGVWSVPEVAAPMGTDALAGTSAVVFGVRFGHRGLSSMRRATSGVGFVDDIAGEVHAGILYDKPELAIGTSQFGLGASYTAAIGFRRIGTLGLFAGARATASWTTFGANSGTHVAVTPVARLELWLGRATIVLDAMTATLAGGRQDALAIHLGRIRRDGPGAKLTRFFSFRAERKVLDATSTLPYEVNGDLSAELDIGDLEATTLTAAWGFGF